MAALGEKLGDGDLTDAGVEQLNTALNNILSLQPEEYGTDKAKNKQTWLEEVSQRLAPDVNPEGFRMCQEAALARGVVAPLLGLTRVGPTDSLKRSCMEVLARLCFGNEAGAAAVVSVPDFLPTLQLVLGEGRQPELLAALQLAQTIAAAPSAVVAPVLPGLTMSVAVQLENTDFRPLPQTAYEVLVSSSFADPMSVLSAVSWPRLASWMSEDKPDYLDRDELTEMTNGLLATNVLALGNTGMDQEENYRPVVVHALESGRFFEYFTTAMQAAAERREWPAGSVAYHNPRKLAEVALKLANLGYKRPLAGTVQPLAIAAEACMDARTSSASLRALRRLCDDIACLDCLLPLEQFRSETLEPMHRDGDEPDATELVSYLEVAENALASAKELYTTMLPTTKRPPSVPELSCIFNDFAPLDGELTEDQLFEALRRVPIGPKREIQGTLRTFRTARNWSFMQFATQIYGSPTVLGWWPSLMEDLRVAWDAIEAEAAPRTPTLQGFMDLWELASKGHDNIKSDVILEEVLPAAGLPVEGEAVYELFAEIRGDVPLRIGDFALWFGRLLKDVAREEAAAAAAAAAEAAAAEAAAGEVPP